MGACFTCKTKLIKQVPLFLSGLSGVDLLELKSAILLLYHKGSLHYFLSANADLLLPGQ